MKRLAIEWWRGLRDAHVAAKSVMLVRFVLVCLLVCYAVWISLDNYVWKFETQYHAQSNGAYAARHAFTKGHLKLYRIVETEFDPEKSSGPVYGPYEISYTGQNEGPFAIWNIYQGRKMGQPHAHALRLYVDAFNERMKQLFDHPEWLKNEAQSAVPPVPKSPPPAKVPASP